MLQTHRNIMRGMNKDRLDIHTTPLALVGGCPNNCQPHHWTLTKSDAHLPDLGRPAAPQHGCPNAHIDAASSSQHHAGRNKGHWTSTQRPSPWSVAVHITTNRIVIGQPPTPLQVNRIVCVHTPISTLHFSLLVSHRAAYHTRIAILKGPKVVTED